MHFAELLKPDAAVTLLLPAPLNATAQGLLTLDVPATWGASNQEYISAARNLFSHFVIPQSYSKVGCSVERWGLASSQCAVPTYVVCRQGCASAGLQPCEPAGLQQAAGSGVGAGWAVMAASSTHILTPVAPSSMIWPHRPP